MRPLAATSRNILKAKAMSDSSLIMPGEAGERGKAGKRSGLAWPGLGEVCEFDKIKNR